MEKSASEAGMKKVIIVSPHFPPSNLAAVHRARLFAKHLPALGWEPIILTIHHGHYEETLDWNLNKLVDPELQVETAGAFPVGPVRLIGDLGLRGWFFLYRKLLSIIKVEKPDFLYITVPSFYAALLGRAVYEETGLLYGIDYIDPWVHTFPGSERTFSRHWWSTKLAGWLEPIAVKRAALITGVAEGYYKPVFKRNPHLVDQALHAAMPYGGEASDHTALKLLDLKPYLFNASPGKFRFVYAGAMLPKAYTVLEQVFKVLSSNQQKYQQVEFHFIGTGRLANDPDSFNIRPCAEKYDLWNKQVFEYPKRIPYLDVLTHLAAADAVFVLGSTEPHYTPSKVYQAILSEKPLLALLHQKSTAAQVIRDANAGLVLTFDGEGELVKIADDFSSTLDEFMNFASKFDPVQVNRNEFEQYSAYNVTAVLAAKLNEVLEKREQ